jgi:hypothetical protein
MVKRMGIPGALFLSIGALGATRPYDESADAHVTLQQGLQQARASGKDPALVVFGANTCKDGRERDKASHGRTSGVIDARHMDDAGIYSFFSQVVAAQHGRPH